jgi:5,10-methylenetetrahydromethanopterin reductase
MTTQVTTGVWMLGGQSITEMVQLAVQAEERGVDSVWVPDGYYGRDPFIALTAVAGATSTIALGTGITSPYLRHPTMLATTFATLDEISRGRVICGMGSGSRDQLAELGITSRSPLGAMRESVAILRSMLAGQRIDLDGTTFTAHVTRLGFRPTRPSVPVVIAAMGPKMCALAGEIADGVFLQYGSQESIRTACASVKEGMARRCDPVGRYRFSVATMMSVHRDRATAIDQIRSTVGRLITEPGAEAFLTANGLDPGAAERVRTGLKDGGSRGMAAAVTDEVATTLAAAGTVEDCCEALRRTVEAGGNDLVVTLRGDQAELGLRVLEMIRG